MARRALLLALLLLAACAEDAAPGPAGCAADDDCPAGQPCGASGRCLIVDDGGGGGGGSDGRVDACRTSTDCRTERFTLIQDLYWDGGGADLVCTVAPSTCPVGTCPGVKECLPQAGERSGLFRCEADEDCASGRCLPLRDGVGICLRSCSNDEDCPSTDERSPSPWGFGCGVIEVRGVTLQSCLPLDGARPEATLCARDGDCGASGEGLGCRFAGRTTTQLDVVPLCLPRPLAPRPTGLRCPLEADADRPTVEWQQSCGGGACVEPCHGSLSGGLSVDLCRDHNFVCSQPCGSSTECPPQYLCSTGDDTERVGAFIDLPAAQLDRAEGRDVKLCLLPARGCLDERDCCPAVNELGLCVGGWGQDRSRCVVEPLDEGPDSRLMTLCTPLDPRLAPPGACCAAHDDCETRLCVPARAGSACDGGSVCSSPCGPDVGLDGVPDSGDELDRCAEPYAPGDYHAASRCRPFDYSRRYVSQAGGERTLTASIHACQ